jgi:hypothetical protein
VKQQFGAVLGVRVFRTAAVLAVVLAGLVIITVARPAQANGNPRIIVHVDGPKGGQVEVSGIWYTWLTEYGINESPYWDVDTGSFLVPHACGLRVYQAFKYTWFSNNTEISRGAIGYPDDLQGVVFTGPITTLSIDVTGTTAVIPPGDLCEQPGVPWYMPGPIENDETAPPAGVDMLVLEFDPPSNQIVPAFEFLDWTGEPVQMDTPGPRDPEIPDPCSVPEFCEGDGDPDVPTPTLDPCVLNPTRPECLPTDPPHRH